MKHYLILGGLRFMHRRLAEKNAILSSIEDRRKMPIIKSDIYKYIMFTDELDYNSIKDFAEFINNKIPIDYVISFREEYQSISAKLASHLGIAPINTIEAIEVVSNKFEMRKVLRDKNIDNIIFYEIDNYTDLCEKISLHKGVSFILKPINLSGSKHIYKVDNDSISDYKTELTLLFDKHKFILEEFIVGEEFSVECISCNGHHSFIGITRKIKDENFVEIGHIVPADLKESQATKIYNYVRSVLNVLKVENGPSHTEVIVNSEKIVIVETHTRFGGDFIPELHQYSTDIDFIDLFLNQLDSKNVELPELQQINHKRYAMILYIKPDKKGIIRSVDIPAYITEDPTVKFAKVFYNVGEEIPSCTDSFSRIGRVLLTGTDINEVKERIKKYTSDIRVVID